MSNTPEKSTSTAVVRSDQKPTAIAQMADRLAISQQRLMDTLKDTVFKGASPSELAALIVVANAYKLNPLTREIFAFPSKGGGIVPVVSVDGWCRIINEHPQYGNCKFRYEYGSDRKVQSITCIMYRKDRENPCEVTEIYEECYRNTDPWRMMPSRMLRHKSLIQCARYAFGFAGIYDEDEARDILRNQAKDESGPAPEIPGIPETLPGEQAFDAELVPDVPSEPEPDEDAVKAEEKAPPPPAKKAPASRGSGVRPALRTVESLLEKDGVSPELFVRYMKEMGPMEDSATSVSDASESDLKAAINNWPKILQHLELMTKNNKEGELL